MDVVEALAGVGEQVAILSKACDELSHRELIELLIGIRDGGQAMVIISHDVDHLDRLCDRTVHLRHGVIDAELPCHQAVSAGESTTTERSTSPLCILSKADSMSPRPIRSVTKASRSKRPWR